MDNNNFQLVIQQPLTPVLAKQEKLMAIENKILVRSKQRIIFNLALEHSDWFIKCLFSRNYPLSEYLIEKYKDKWDWNELSCNKFLPWSIELIEKYINEWNWIRLSYNQPLPWTTELIERFEDKWDWNSFAGLTYNESLPWTVELIEKFKNKWD